MVEDGRSRRSEYGFERLVGELELRVRGEAGEVPADDDVRRLLAPHLAHQLLLHLPAEVRAPAQQRVVEEAEQPLGLGPALAPGGPDGEVNVGQVEDAVGAGGGGGGSGSSSGAQRRRRTDGSSHRSHDSWADISRR